MAGWQRTVTCGDLRAEHAGDTATLNGWVNGWRDHGGLAFVDLRDRYGVTQVVFDKEDDAALHELARSLRNEYVVSVTGRVALRIEGSRNPKLPTGDIELRATTLTVLNRSDPAPFDVSAEGDTASEEIRLRYRYIDLRRPRMQQILKTRHALCKAIRDYLDELGFCEIETPILGRSTPEGARDYLVPSRVSPGSWYALPQSPQLYKQLLMVAGMDRYYQIARCFRDEDLRANRQPEFTQLDLEMSFVDADDVIRCVEGLSASIVASVTGKAPPTPFARLTYADAMERYGVDKPDLRFGLEIRDVTPLCHETEFAAFRSAACVRGVCAKLAAAKYSRKDLDGLTAFAAEFGAKGLAWLKVEPDKLNGPIAKFFPGELGDRLKAALGAEPGDLMLFVAGDREATHAPLAQLRNRLGKELQLYDPKTLHCSWVIEFPMFERDEEENRWVAKHHPFTALLDEDWARLESEPGAVRAKAYDLIVNGEEAGGGTIRIHDSANQQRMFKMLGMSEEEAKARFGFLFDAFRFGAPHGGIAFGLDRWVMLLENLENIRDCIAFPKTARAADLLTGAPAPVEKRQLKDLGLS